MASSWRTGCGIWSQAVRRSSTVLAPVPSFPGRGGAVPPREERHGITVHHPRFVAPPGLGMYTAPFALHATARAVMARLFAEGARFDAIDAHYLIPTAWWPCGSGGSSGCRW
jgi:hypothetical protein